ncbi:hypothetical protein KEM55_006169 [Ascosphaera atra]|nr:hypothetical protein KEM55_006169 [Ascosphaera atra]
MISFKPHGHPDLTSPGLLPDPLVLPGGANNGSGSLRFNPEFMQSEADYGTVIREETMPDPATRAQEQANAHPTGGATASGVNAALDAAALAAGLDPKDIGKNGIGFERSFMDSSHETDNLPPPTSSPLRRLLDSAHQGGGEEGDTSTTTPLFDPSHAKKEKDTSGLAGPSFENIESKDIIALMEHLAARDAQRNARDTEILITLVRSAADMRNNFDELRRYIAHQDELIMESNDRQHQATQRAVGGPRPPPAGYTAKRSLTGAPGWASSSEDDGEKSKRKNVFKRALKGLSGKSTNELARIEDMLNHLLSEVEKLRIQQGNDGLAGYNQLDERPRQLSIQDRYDSGSGSDRPRTQDSQQQKPQKQGQQQQQQRKGRPQSWPKWNIPTDPATIVDEGLNTHQPHRISPIEEADERSMRTADRDDAPLTTEEERYLDRTRIVDENSLARNNRARKGPIASPRVSTGDEQTKDAYSSGSGNSNRASSTDDNGARDMSRDEEHSGKKRGFFKKFKKGFFGKDRNAAEQQQQQQQLYHPHTFGGEGGSAQEQRASEFLDASSPVRNSPRPAVPPKPFLFCGLSHE